VTTTPPVTTPPVTTTPPRTTTPPVTTTSARDRCLFRDNGDHEFLAGRVPSRGDREGRQFGHLRLDREVDLASGQAITQLWNGALTTSGSAVTVKNMSYNGSLAAGATTAFGFTANGASSTPALTCTSP
jgi:hypothetical protein